MVIFQFALMTTYDCGCDKFPFRIELPFDMPVLFKQKTASAWLDERPLAQALIAVL